LEQGAPYHGSDINVLTLICGVKELGRISTLLIVIKCKDIFEVNRPYLKGNISFLRESFE
jgi:hypothetical protein